MPRTFNSLSELLAELPNAIERALETAAPLVGQLIEQRAQNKLGTYQPGWPQLHEQTQRERVEQ